LYEHGDGVWFKVEASHYCASESTLDFVGPAHGKVEPKPNHSLGLAQEAGIFLI